MKSANYHSLQFERCNYSNKLIDKLLVLNEQTQNNVDIQEVKKSIYYARKYHGEQKRESGELYYSHPIEVAYMLAESIALGNMHFFRTDMFVTSILHDTIEDTHLNFNDINTIFGFKVANQVQDLTRVKTEGKITSAEMVKSLSLQGKYDMLLIKLFDRLHNIRTIGAKSPEKAMKIVQETMQTFLLLSAYFEAPIIEDELYQLCLKKCPEVLDDFRLGLLDDNKHFLFYPDMKNVILQT